MRLAFARKLQIRREKVREHTLHVILMPLPRQIAKLGSTWPHRASVLEMAMQKLQGELSAIAAMKNAGQIESPVAKQLREAATATALGSTAAATPAAAASGSSGGTGPASLRFSFGCARTRASSSRARQSPCQRAQRLWI